MPASNISGITLISLRLLILSTYRPHANDAPLAHLVRMSELACYALHVQSLQLAFPRVIAHQA